jgi:DNA (cytosine-5)-methyltransferase 1
VTCGDLFAGIGGMSLGLERAGFEIRWQVEREPFCENILARHWPHVARRRQVQFAGAANLERVDLIAGGFPCQDISSAHTSGTRLALAGRKSGVWREFQRIVAELSPRWVLIENVDRWRAWVPDVRRDLFAIGYASLPLRVCSSLLGAPHRRRRIFMVAHADGDGQPLRAVHAEASRVSAVPEADRDWGAPPPRGFRVANGVPRQMDRLKALGNAVVPQVVEVIGRAIMEIERRETQWT